MGLYRDFDTALFNLNALNAATNSILVGGEIMDSFGRICDHDGTLRPEIVEFPPKPDPEQSETVAELPPEPKPNPLLIEVRAKYWLERYRNYQEVRPREDWDKAAVLADEELARFDKRFSQ